MSKLHICDDNIKIIDNNHIRVVDDLKERNKYYGKVIASEYYGNKFTFDETFAMFEDYKKAFMSLDSKENETIILSAPSVIASVNAFYGAIEANKIVNSFGPGLLYAYTDDYINKFDSKTIFVFDSFLNENFINKLARAGIKNIIITSVTDYMNPQILAYSRANGLIPKEDFLDSYIRSGKKIPQGVQMIRLSEFAKQGANIKESRNFPYRENQIAARFLTGATTSQVPKCVEVYADGLNKMSQMYDKIWFDFQPGDVNTVFIPMFYATGMIHGVHAGLLSTLTNVYKPKYDRFAFAKDLLETKPKITLVAPSHLSTLSEANLEDNSLSQLKYVFIGGEAILPSQMEKFRKTAQRLGIGYILNAYGMTETASMSGMSDKVPQSLDDVTIRPAPGVKFRIVDPITREELSDNKRGILEVYSPCRMAGYCNEELNKKIFTNDGYINTGDVAIRYSDGRYRVFGRSSDYFTNNHKKYAMFDIEEQVLKHPGVLEAEVIKFNIQGNEYPAIVIVVKQDWYDKLDEIIKYISTINVSGMEYLIGTRIIDKFKTNPITSKRDYLSLPLDKNGYYKYLISQDKIYCSDIIDDKINTYCDFKSIEIYSNQESKKMLKK